MKPENLLLDENFNIKLCDFGWATVLSSDQDTRNSICGTYEYMPPEIIYEQSHSKKADIWCLGILLYEMLHGKPPYSATSLVGIKKEFEKKLIEIYSCFSTDVRGLLRDLLKLDPKSRPSIDQVLAHPVFEKHRPVIDAPLSDADKKVLMQNYMKNTEQGTMMDLPLIIENGSSRSIQAAKSVRDLPENFFASTVRTDPKKSHLQRSNIDKASYFEQSMFFAAAPELLNYNMPEQLLVHKDSSLNPYSDDSITNSVATGNSSVDHSRLLDSNLSNANPFLKPS